MTRSLDRIRFTAIAAAFALTACVSTDTTPKPAQGDFGVLVMAHGGPKDWNRAVLDAAKPLESQYPIDVAFGMADPKTLQDSVHRLEERGVRRIAVVRLFVSGESFQERTEQILGLRAGAPPPPVEHADHHAHHDEGEHDMALWRVESTSSFAMAREGLLDSPEMGDVLAERARQLSRRAPLEDVLILAHGPGDEEENERWLAKLDARAQRVREALPFHSVQVETLREDWPEKRAAAEQRVRSFVADANQQGRTAIVIPFRVQGFGPYADVLKGLRYRSNGVGLLPDAQVSRWIERQATELENGPFSKGQ